ncbi:nuclear receptor subfamily 0 group B member 2a isoform X1 [Corythoichthys intestinalis]|uniref:nuclear receptor subfamily 0 group B member 2a isoform X1 n=1 Tax=Corythoichthys intestinalis TaxID=161448 RepID=UPI0025A664A8|nr:nuclear receptor subfamily 0 group B member 2a isoform X1 [Corythoichthys intestinalis]XP_061789839.1 nuclear receptor subfamily 0 group B member 2-like [Nerophis lumbriciformis]
MMDNQCQCSSDRLLNPILFNILSQLDNSCPSPHDYNSIPHRCNCELRRTVSLKRPSEICKEASAVLVKTVYFMKNLPAFNQLPPNDQFMLLKNCWAPLFILGLAQEHVDFEVEDVPADSMLKKILLRQEGGTEMEQPTMAGVSKLKSCLKKFWSLDLSPKEYAYLKGTTIFNPDIPDLNASLFIEGLQQEAQQALSEVVRLLHPTRQERFARILLTASMLQSITPSLIIELLFRPIIGHADLFEVLVDMLFCR